MAMLGLHNIADAAPGAASGYPQLSDEFIVKADPKVIILADTVCCGQSAKTVAKRPGWRSIAAVRTRRGRRHQRLGRVAVGTKRRHARARRRDGDCPVSRRRITGLRRVSTSSPSVPSTDGEQPF